MQFNVQLSNERFLLRFGVDRIITLLGQHLKDSGFDVSFTCLRADLPALRRISAQVDIVDMPPNLDIGQADRYASTSLIDGWRRSRPDVLVIGGWPFFEAAAQAAALGVYSIFIDAGAVPHDDLPSSALSSQLEIRRLRQYALPSISAILPISDFIRRTQTEPDRGRNASVQTVLLGADHLSARRFEASSPLPGESNIITRLDELKLSGRQLILLAGRFEEKGYKNSPSIFRILRGIKADIATAHLLVLGGSESVVVPSRMEDAVTVIDAVSDATLEQIIRRIDLGISTSRWEGFNLPIAEMQHLSKPVLAFNVGAHPEVIVNPWFLCEDEIEMIQKAVLIITKELPSVFAGGHLFDDFRNRFGWIQTLQLWTHAISMGCSHEQANVSKRRRLLLIDVSNSCRDPANSGVVRVTRRLTAQLAADADFDLVFMRWDADSNGYRLVDPVTGYLASNSGPIDWLGVAAAQWEGLDSVDAIINAADPACSARPILFMPEIALDGSAAQRVSWGEARGLATCSILYDLLPIYCSDFVAPEIVRVFPAYIGAIQKCDKILSISEFTASEFRRYTGDAHDDASVEVIGLPGQFGDYPRAVETNFSASIIPEILCVCTIEPRKNHRTLIRAIEDLQLRRPELSFRLNLVGNCYAGAENLDQWLQEIVQHNKSVIWHKILPDEAVRALYQRSVFCVYPSLAEGYGLPIMESMWMGRPCICHAAGVMAELARGGGCYAVDASDYRNLSAAIEELLINKDFLENLREQACRRFVATWEDYAESVSQVLHDLPS